MWSEGIEVVLVLSGKVSPPGAQPEGFSLTSLQQCESEGVFSVSVLLVLTLAS